MDKSMKIAFGMIVFEGEYVLKQCLQSVYPYAEQILIAEGPVRYWQEQGYTTSKDRTNQILDTFPDPDNKIKIVHNQFNEKDDQCKAYMKFLKDDIDYIWNLDSDEIYKGEHIEQLIDLLKKNQYTSVGIKSCSFYGGFNRYITGFEEQNDQFVRIFKMMPGCTWATHRPPAIKYPIDITKNHLCSDELYDKTKIRMYHYSYVFPKQVYKKLNYYKAAVSKDRCINNYFFEIYLPWILGNLDEKKRIENKYNGVHEFLPYSRPSSYTEEFNDTHPKVITDDILKLQTDILKQLQYIKEKLNENRTMDN